MQRLSKTGRQIRELIEVLNASSERTEVFAEACEQLEKVIGFTSAILLPHGPEDFSFLKDGHLVLNARTRDSLAYADYYVRHDPLYTDWVVNPANLNKATRNTDIVSARQILDSEFGHDFMSKVPALYVLGGLLTHRNEVVGAFAIHRGKGDKDFSAHDKDIINLLLPFFARTLYAIEHPHHTLSDTPLLSLGLTPRETEIIRYVLDGWSYRAIAAALRLHIQTIKKHMQRILAKAEARNRHDLALKFLGLRWESDGNDPLANRLRDGVTRMKS